MKTNRIFLAGGLAAVAAAGCGRPEPEPDRRMNILYIMTDDHTAQMMSCYDRRYASTPNLDRIAAEGVRFTNSFVANSLSGPSRACMLTGKHSHANGYTDNTLCPAFDASQQTFPKLLQEAGYETAVIGKWHLGSLPTGFDHWEIVPGQGDYYNPDFIRQTGDTVRVHGYLTNLITDRSIEWLEQGRDPEKPFCLLVHHKAQHRNWMADTCNLALYEDRTFPLPETFFDDYAGRPAAAAQEMSIASDVDMDPVYDLKMLKEGHPGRLKGAYEWILSRMDSAQRTAWDRFYDPIIEDFYARNPQGRERAEWKFNRYMRDYLKTLKSLDDNVGRLLRYLDESGLAENTLVVYTSDQGFYMGEHGWFDKRFMYEESFRTPLLIRYPKKIAAGSECKALVQNIDFAPTLLDVAGVKVPETMEGHSLQPLFRGEKPADWRKSIYYHYYDYPTFHLVRRHDGIRTDRYKLIHFYGKGGENGATPNMLKPGTRENRTFNMLKNANYFPTASEDLNYNELYDLQTDPQELNNLYGTPGYEVIIADLQKLLDNYRKTLKVEKY